MRRKSIVGREGEQSKKKKKAVILEDKKLNLMKIGTDVGDKGSERRKINHNERKTIFIGERNQKT